ncbi:MAG: metallophosphoesterase family protein, partial [Solirubrobacterales bacterium]
AQNAFLRRDLAEHRDQRTFIFFHHPVSEYATAYAAPPVVFGVRPDRGGVEFLDLMARYPNVVGVFNAHTHRNFVSYSPRTGARLPYIESGAAKEYPGGYSIVRVYSGGYSRNFYRPRNCEFCRDWTATTRSEYLGLYPYYTLGTLDARNFTHVYGCPIPTPPPSPPGNAGVGGGAIANRACTS